MAAVAYPGLAVELKHELKAWERAFAAAHQGRKATKADIKSDPSIATKYKQYDELCRPQKRVQSTPKKARDPPALPPKTHGEDVHTTPRATRTSRQQTSPLKPMSPTPQALKQRLGPTPQKDGQILSLFEDLYAATPSRPRTALSELDSNVAATPSKTGQHSDETHEEEEGRRLGRTPTSSGKRYMLDSFATPMKRKRDDIAQTPTSCRGIISTPQFLQRTSMLFKTDLDPLAEHDEAEVREAMQPPFKKRGFVRSLSSIIRGLKDQEVEKADEDWDLLQEMESDPAPRKPLARSSAKLDAVPETQIEELEDDEVEMPLGPDVLQLSDEDDGAGDRGALDAYGNPRKAWKKKGLKRQTRRVNMRPPTREPTKADEPVSFESVLQDYNKMNDGDSSDSEFDDASLPKNNLKHANKENSNIVSKIKRKVSAAAHANYCKLKIKNKNSKSKGRGRFGRR
ncbi:hypothetical protein K461DRAFT_290311 [Myriangium duriaei CBS 260.36]|uniref:DNA replication regulator SLD2 n=1 Tax=Myriangium duriaei CBS 260.36 TaxID=1168546 RepID=A0A9P4JDD0_9PEZI|nr:hypothetical protein K461DRAFT_290311 [Myriangium duriaei CBS 260.36]